MQPEGFSGTFLPSARLGTVCRGSVLATVTGSSVSSAPSINWSLFYQIKLRWAWRGRRPHTCADRQDRRSDSTVHPRRLRSGSLRC